MASYYINGGKPLFGEVSVGGCKNAVLPILFATLLTEGENVFENVPDITDVKTTLDILRALGVRIRYYDRHTVGVDATDATYAPIGESLVRAIRASTYLIGSSLGRFGRVRLYPFGGCAFCERPIDLHLYAARSFGASVDGDSIRYDNAPHGARVHFSTVSVGATVNALLLSSCLPEESLIENVAIEPHVMSLVRYLTLAGAGIRVTSSKTPTMRVQGGKLHGVRMRMIPDMIEAGTYLLSGAITGGRVRVCDVDPTHLTSFLCEMEGAGATVSRDESRVELFFARPPKPMHLTTAPYPGLATDLAPLICAFLAHTGCGSMQDTVFPERRSFLRTYSALGASFREEGGRIHFLPPTPARENTVTLPDLRAGAGAILLALSSLGSFTLCDEGEFVLRGYEDIKGKLQSLGAYVK